MRVLSIVCYKGGVGKSTVAAHCAETARRRGYRVLLIDLEPQGSVTEQLARHVEVDFDASDVLLRPDRAERALYRLRPPSTTAEEAEEEGSGSQEATGEDDTGAGTLDLLPGSNGLLGTAAQMTATGDRDAVGRFIQDGVPAGRYDLCVIDTSPTPGPLSVSAVKASDIVLVPFKLEANTFKGLNQLNDVLGRLGEPPRRLIAPSEYHAGRRQSKDIAEALASHYGTFPDGDVLPAIRTNQGFPHAYQRGETIYESASHSARTRGTEDYDRLFRCLLQSLDLPTRHV